MFRLVRRLRIVRDDEGATSVEYAVMLALITLAIAGISQFGSTTATTFTDVNTKINTATSS